MCIRDSNGTALVPIIAWLGHAETRSYDLGLSQILTKNWIAGLNVNVITDEGFLANPYRSIRYFDPSNPKGYSLGSQVYPDTRTSTAIQGQAKYYPVSYTHLDVYKRQRGHLESHAERRRGHRDR